MRLLTLAFTGLFTGSVVHAAGDALVIGNSAYNGVQTLFAAAQINETAAALQAQGFDVIEARDASGAAMAEGFGQFVSGLAADDGSAVIVLAGAFLHGPTGAYLLPATDGAALSDSAVLLEAFPLDAALSVLAKYPGRAFLVLSESAVSADFGDFLEAGVGNLDLPSGVTVLRGPESAVSRFASGELTKVGQPVVAAAEAAGLTVEGFATNDLVLVRPADVPVVPAAEAPVAPVTPDVIEPDVAEEAVPDAPEQMADVPEASAEEAVETVQALIEDESAPETPTEVAPVVAEDESPEEAADEVVISEGAPEADPVSDPVAESVAEAEEAEDTRSDVEIAADEAAWRAARIRNSETSYEAYLVAQPNGVYANAATQRLKAIKADPFYDLRRAEEFLDLDREARRDIQRDLDELGVYHWAVDGIFGDGTRDAVRAWQKDAGLDATGYLDLNQIGKLNDQAEALRTKAKQEQARRQAAAAAEAKRQREAAAAAAAAARKAAADAAKPAEPARPSDQAMWAEVERLGSEAAVRRYLRAYPSGARSTQARQMLQVIERRRGG